jgi:hypothetical protein
MTFLVGPDQQIVMRGHSPSKTGVDALMTRASIIFEGWIAGSSPAMTNSRDC